MMLRHKLGSLLLLTLMAATPVAAQTGGAVLIKGAQVFDGRKIVGVRDVLVTDGRIARISRGIVPPVGVTTVDGSGKTLLPGLMDAHVHVFPMAADDALRLGVTTEFDMFSLADPATTSARKVQRVSYAATDKADVWSAGRGVTLPGAHPTGLAKAMGVDIPTLLDDGDAAAFVQAEVGEGADYIKIFQDAAARNGKARFPEFSERQLGTIVDAAHQAGRKVIVHVSQEKDAAVAFRLGADALAHMFESPPASRDTIKLAKARRSTVIATLSVLAGASGDPIADNLAADPALRPFLSPAQVAMLGQKFPAPRPTVLTNAIESVRRFHRDGVRILAGTDAPNPTTAHGASMHAELQLLVRAGLTPAEALSAATAQVADFFDIQDRGRIAVGKRADLLLVDGDPTRGIARTRHITAIWKNGFAVDRTRLPVMPQPSSDPRGSELH